MSVELPLDRMTKAEKIEAMEALWADLSRDPDDFSSPAWHAEVLREREQRVGEGHEVPIDQESARRRLRDRPE